MVTVADMQETFKVISGRHTCTQPWMRAHTHARTLCLKLCPTSLPQESSVKMLFHTMKLAPNLEPTGPEKLIILSYVVASSLSLNSNSYWFHKPRNNEMIICEQVKWVVCETVWEFLSHFVNGYMGLWSQCFSGALRGLLLFVMAGVWVMVIRQTDCVAGVADTARQGWDGFWCTAVRDRCDWHTMPQVVFHWSFC